MTPDELAAHEARHQPTRRGAVCRTCEGLWPCPSQRASSALREAWAEVEAMRRGEVDGVFTSVVHGCCERAEKAEAAIARVRALCDEAERWALSSPSVSTSRIRAALDGGDHHG